MTDNVLTTSTTMITVAEYVADFLVKKGVRHVFGYDGGAILKLLDSFVKTGKIAYVQNYHEQASAFSADAYGRLSGNIGVALATSGPGATNLITGIANAQLDSVPTLFITGQDYAANLQQKNGARQNGFQDLDIVSVVKPLTKYATVLYDENNVREEFEKAFYYAQSGRPGAVLIDIPIDVQFKKINPETLLGFTPPVEGGSDYSCLRDIIHEIKEAKRPVILAGGGIHLSKAAKVFSDFVQRTQIPVVNTTNGLDAVVDSYSFAGLHGNTFANLAVQNADLMIVIGARLGQRQVGKKPENYTRAKIIHVDIDTSELGRVMPEVISVKSDLKPFLVALNDNLRGENLPDFSGWHAQIRDWEARYSAMAHMNKIGIDPVVAFKKIMTYVDDDAVITNDVGQNQMWVCQAFRKKGSQRLLNSTGLGAMGYSLPAAIGAVFACPGQQIICCTGDGGLHMNIQELMLVGQRQLPIKCIVFNNNALGMMREVQKRYYNENYVGACVEDFLAPDLEKIAAAYHLGYTRIDDEAQIPNIKEALSIKGPVLIDLRLAYDTLLSNRYDEQSVFDAERLNVTGSE